MGVKWNGPEFLARAQAGAMRGVQVWIGMVEQRAVDLITGPPKTGRVYRRRGVTHQASAPGEAPASDTGGLVNNRTVQLVPERQAARLTFHSKHAPMLEEGTKDMEPRPFAKRSIQETLEDGQRACAHEIVSAIVGK